MCPECRRIIDAQIRLRNNQVIMRKRCPEHGWFESLVYNDAALYTSSLKYNKPGTIPLEFSTEIVDGCPHDCGLCPEHQQHACLGIIEVNTACNFACPVCFSDAGPGFNLTLEDVEGILDHFVATEGSPEVVQFSGGEPSIHPNIIAMLEMAFAKGIKYVMLNTNGRRIAQDDAFLAELARVRPVIYLQFDGFDESTTWTIRREKNLLPEKMQALDRLASAGLDVVLVPTIERGINLHEVGAIVKFGVQHPAVKGINFQPMFHSGRHIANDPLQRLTIPDVLKAIDEQADGMFLASDFVPVPCCFPTCNSVTYAWVDGDTVLPMTRIVEVDDYLDYITNRSVPDLEGGIKKALEGLWSATAVPGTDAVSSRFQIACAACNLPDMELEGLKDHIFMIMITDFMDPYTFNIKNLMKCCKEFLLPDGRQIPFCAYNNVGYREQVREQLGARKPRAIAAGRGH
jgi:7,8-dihydro-6-hydroxymethylpterin dimethyltransferase